MAPDEVKHRPPTPLAVRRVAAGLTREQLAVMAGVSHSTVVRAELRYRRPNRSSLRLLAQALDCPPADLIDQEPADL